MNYLKMLAIAAGAAMAFTAFASSASATTLEVGGAVENKSVTISASLKSGSSAVLSRTDGSLANTCTASTAHGSTTSFSNPVSGPLSKGGLTFSSCTRTVTVHKEGSLEITRIGTTTNGTVTSKGAEVTVGSPFGTLTCVTGEGVDIGTLRGTGDIKKHAELDISAVLDCGFLVPSAKWAGTYVVTTPTGLGVTA